MRTVEKINTDIRNLLNKNSVYCDLILIGSCSRNEETYYLNEMISDIEYICIFDIKNTDTQVVVSQCFDTVKSKYQHVSIDISYYSSFRAKNLPKRFIFFEAKTKGVLIFGEGKFFKEMPNVNLKNLDYFELNDILLHRVYNLSSSIDLINRNPKMFNYLINRNILDLITVILPYKGFLISGYKDRGEALRSISDSIGHVSNQKIIDIYQSSLIRKVDYSKNLDSFSRGDMEKFIALLNLVEKTVQDKRKRIFGISFRQLLSYIIKGEFYSLIYSRRKLNLYIRLKECLEELSEPSNSHINEYLGIFPYMKK